MTAPGCYNTHIRFFTYSNDKLFSQSWKYWIMIDYGKTKKISDEIWRLDCVNLIDWCRLITIDWVSDIRLTRWFDLFNHNEEEEKLRERTWLIRPQPCRCGDIPSRYLRMLSTISVTPYGRQLILPWRYNREGDASFFLCDINVYLS